MGRIVFFAFPEERQRESSLFEGIGYYLTVASRIKNRNSNGSIDICVSIFTSY
jgi:hypothetical protein